MNSIKKMALGVSAALICLNLSACSSNSSNNSNNSSSTSSKVTSPTISLSKTTASEKARIKISKKITANLEKAKKKAEAGNENDNYALYLNQIVLLNNGNFGVSVDEDNFSQLSSDQLTAVGESTTKLIEKSLSNENINFKKGKDIFVAYYTQEGHEVVPPINYIAKEYRYKKDAEEAKVPTEYKNALVKAQTYSDNMFMSKQRIYKQLISKYGEDFSKKAAKYAIKHVEADWNYNALQKAKSYQKDQNMSKDRIKHQLISPYGEEFTEAQAEYAVSHLPK